MQRLYKFIIGIHYLWICNIILFLTLLYYGFWRHLYNKYKTTTVPQTILSSFFTRQIHNISRQIFYLTEKKICLVKTILITFALYKPSRKQGRNCNPILLAPHPWYAMLFWRVSTFEPYHFRSNAYFMFTCFETHRHFKTRCSLQILNKL